MRLRPRAWRMRSALADDGFAGGEAAIAVGVGGVDGFAVELGEQDVGDGTEDGLGRTFENVGETNLETCLRGGGWWC